MRWTAALQRKIFDRIQSGLLIGDEGAPNGRVTVQADWTLRSTSPVYGNSVRGSYRYYRDPEAVEHEIPSIQSIQITRSLSQDIATCQITIYNAWHEINTAQPELAGQLGKPGYFWPKRGDGDSGPSWNQSPSMGAYRKDGTWDNDFSWRNVLVEDALLFTYQGYGGRPKPGNFLSIDHNLATSNVVMTGAWLVDSVIGTSQGLMTLNCRDVGRLLLDQIVFPPTIPSALYPLEYVPPGKSRFDSLWGPRARSVPSSAPGSRGPVQVNPGNTSADGIAGDPFIGGEHALAAAIDGDIQDFYLTEAFPRRIDGPLETDTAWFELEIPAGHEQNVSSIALTAWAGGYKIFVSVMVDGEWAEGTLVNGTITENKSVLAPLGQGKDIPYVSEAYIPETTPGGDSQRGEQAVNIELRRMVSEQESFYSGVLAGSEDPADRRLHQRLYGKEIQVQEGELVQFNNVDKIRVSIQRFYYSGMPNSAGDQYRAGFKTVQVYCLGQNKTPYEALANDVTWTWSIQPHPTRGYWVLENGGTIHGFGDAADFDSDSPGYDPLDDIQSERRYIQASYRALPAPYGHFYNHRTDPYMAGTPTISGTTLDGSPGETGHTVLAGGKVYSLTQNRAHDMAVTPSGKGFWIVDWMGNVKAYGDAELHTGYNGQTDYVVNSPQRYYDWRIKWLEIYRGGAQEFYDGKGVLHAIDPNWKYNGNINTAWDTAPRVTCNGIAATNTGNGYWILFSNGSVFAFGDAIDNPKGLPSHIPPRPNDPTATAFRGIQTKYLHYGRVSYGYTKDYYVGGKGTAIESHPKKKGFWVVDECGQVFAYGDAVHHGELKNRIYNEGADSSFTLKLFDYAVDITSTDTGDGYWILFNSGLVAAFGDAVSKGPLELDSINKQFENNVAVGGSRLDPELDYYKRLFYSMARDQDGRGYWVLRADGEVYFHEATDWGNPGWNGLTGYRWHEGNFDGDYAQIVKELAMWAGFTFFEEIKDQSSIQVTAPEGYTVDEYGNYDPTSNTAGTLEQYEQINMLGGIETTAIKQDIEIQGDKWDKKYIIDVIRELAEVVGYVVYVDQEGGLRFRSPNWWRSGNFDYNGWRIWTYEEDGEVFRIPEQWVEDTGAQPFIPEIHEEVDLMSYSATINNTDKRWQILIGTETPDPQDISRTGHVQHFPPFANEEVRPGVPSSRHIPRTSIWTSHVFENADERKLMAEVIGIHNYFAGRTGTVTATANPCLDVDDQVRLIERSTSETFIHRIQGITTRMNLDDGTYIMDLQTHWLGSADNWVLVTTAEGEPWDAEKEGGYGTGARVSYNGVTYISTIADNATTPGTGPEWVEQNSVENPYVVISDQLDSWQRETDRGLELSGYAAKNPYDLQVTGTFTSGIVGMSDNGAKWGVWVDDPEVVVSNDETTFPCVNYKSFGRGLKWPFTSATPLEYEDDGETYNAAVLRHSGQDFFLTLGYTPDHLQGFTSRVLVVEDRLGVNSEFATQDVDIASDLDPAGGVTIIPSPFEEVVIGPGTGTGTASSFHAWWHKDPPIRYEEVSVTLEVVEQPTVDDLYYWAMQLDFTDASNVVLSGGHCGLQWIDGYPDYNAVNWGGYISDEGQTEFGPGLPSQLVGSTSSLPSAASNDNTRNYAWNEATEYRFRVFKVANQGGEPANTTRWRCTITNLTTNVTTTIRDLYAYGDRIHGVAVWSEIFAGCNDPTATVRWSDFEAIEYGSGDSITIDEFYIWYQVDGCENTNTYSDGSGGIGQRTNTTRTTPHDSYLNLGPAPPPPMISEGTGPGPTVWNDFLNLPDPY
jgi:hypothetical protein